MRLLYALTLAAAWPALGLAQSGEEQAHETVTIQVPDTPDIGPRPGLATVAKAIAEKTNAFRQQEGRGPVAVDAGLAKAAQGFADWMAANDRYGHTADGRRPAERARAAGYDDCIVLENIAYAFDSRGFSAGKLTDKFVIGWQNSPGHRRNMLDRDVTETGVAVARSDATGHYYAVQMFGRPKSAAIEFSIENKAGEAFTYTLGGREFALEPRYTRTHTTCRPPAVTFGWEGAKPVDPKGGEKYVITKAGERFAVAKE